MAGYESLHPQYTYLFNSYYNAIGERHCRPKRGLISRPTVADTYRYRAYVDEHMLDLLETADDELLERIAPLVVLGLHHEQQHQELLVTDLKHVLAANPLHPVYVPREPARAVDRAGTALDRLRRRAGLDRPRRARASPSTTRARATSNSCSRSSWRRGR